MADDDSLSHSSFSLSSLLCQETEICLLEEEEDAMDEEDASASASINLSSYSSVFASDEDDDYVETLFDREITFGGFENQEPLALSNWVKCARLNAITWILKTRALFGFRFQTAYLSIAYFDRFLSRRAIDCEKTWAIRLLSIACLSLAAKMEECRVPPLSDFNVEDYSFENRVIQKMELLILNTLEWRMCSITPFDFIQYFINKFNTNKQDSTSPSSSSPSSSNATLSRTDEIILDTMKEMNLMDHRPSIIAAAATLLALDQRLTRATMELKINAISSSRFLQIEELYSCYQIMQKQEEIEKQQHQKPKSIISPDFSPIHYQNSSITSSGVTIKRKRLEFNDFDQNYGSNSSMPDEKRHR